MGHGKPVKDNGTTSHHGHDHRTQKRLQPVSESIITGLEDQEPFLAFGNAALGFGQNHLPMELEVFFPVGFKAAQARFSIKAARALVRCRYWTKPFRVLNVEGRCSPCGVKIASLVPECYRDHVAEPECHGEQQSPASRGAVGFAEEVDAILESPFDGEQS